MRKQSKNSLPKPMKAASRKAKGSRLERKVAQELREAGEKHSNSWKHGLKNSRIYRTWSHMKGRCQDINDKAYKYYGGRGIKVCDKWQSFLGFFEDMKGAYEDNLSLERVDVNGNYEKKNCKWIPLKDQNKNKTTNRFITYKGKTQTIQDWAKEIGIKRTTLRMRLDKYGYSLEKAFTEKVTYNH